MLRFKLSFCSSVVKFSPHEPFFTPFLLGCPWTELKSCGTVASVLYCYKQVEVDRTREAHAKSHELKNDELKKDRKGLRKGEV